MISEILKKSLQIVRHRPYLWLLAFLSGEMVGGGIGSASSNSGLTGGDFAGNAAGEQIAQWVQTNFFYLLGILLFLIILGVVLWFVSCIAEGAIILAVAEIDAERELGFRESWKQGSRYFWKILGLRLLMGIFPLLCFLFLIGLIVLLGRVSLGNVLVGLALIMAMIFIVILFIGSVFLMGIVTLLANRAIVLSQGGIRSSLQSTFDLIKALPGEVSKIYFVWLGVNFLLGTIVTVGEMLIAIPFTFLFFVAYGSHLGMMLISIGAVGIGIVVSMGLFLSSVAGSYTSAYWTLAYKRLLSENI